MMAFRAIRAALYLGVALMLLSTVFPNPFPVLIVGGMVALGAYGADEGRRERRD